ncbi:MAG: RNA methyltransferase [Lactimicrobium sp.]|jgi:23S rRNA (guanosine2251-2'-O)-methyltransferase|uniref:TrmH family RNA methyltransferase n=1 Tax=Lactimicrobium sp. TaxID=2563780 RepID=UPI002F358F99
MIQIEGGLSVKAAMLAGRRQIETIYLDEARHDKDAHFIVRKAQEKNISVILKTRSWIDAHAQGRTHGGLIAQVSPRSFQQLSEVLSDNPFVFVVEGVEDPFNLGYIMRSLYSAGASGLLLSARNWQPVESTILKASAGASEYLNVVLSEDLPGDIAALKKQGLKAYAAMRKDAIAYWDADYTEPCLIAIGGEMRGLSSKVLKEMDQNIYIPYANDFRAALNAAGAAAAIAFEGFRQRNGH